MLLTQLIISSLIIVILYRIIYLNTIFLIKMLEKLSEFYIIEDSGLDFKIVRGGDTKCSGLEC